MKNTADFLDDLRAKLGATSDGKLALAMGWKRQQASTYRQKRETFSDETCLKIARALEIEPGHIMTCMAVQRAKTPETRSAWERVAGKVAAAVLLAAGIGAPSPGEAGQFDNNRIIAASAVAAVARSTHYASIVARRLLRRALAWLAALFPRLAPATR